MGLHSQPRCRWSLMKRRRFERLSFCTERRKYNSASLCDFSLILHPLPPTFSCFGSHKCRFVETSRPGAQKSSERKPLSLWNRSFREKTEMCHSVCVRQLLVLQSICAADCTRAGGDVPVFRCWVCFGLVLGFFVCSCCFLHASLSAWEAVIHCTWLIPLSGFCSQYFTRDANSLTAHRTH